MAPSRLYCPAEGSMNCTMYPAGLCQAAASTCNAFEPAQAQAALCISAPRHLQTVQDLWTAADCACTPAHHPQCPRW